MWVREGNCPPEKCQGQCCKHLGIWLDSAMDEEWLVTRGLMATWFNDKFLVDIPHRCQHLTAGNLCALYGRPERPTACELWPIEPSQILLDDCGFSFKWVPEEVVT